MARPTIIIRPARAEAVDGMVVLTERDGRVYPIKTADEDGAQFLAAAHRLEINRTNRTRPRQ